VAGGICIAAVSPNLYTQPLGVPGATARLACARVTPRQSGRDTRPPPLFLANPTTLRRRRPGAHLRSGWTARAGGELTPFSRGSVAEQPPSASAAMRSRVVSGSCSTQAANARSSRVVSGSQSLKRSRSRCSVHAEGTSTKARLLPFASASTCSRIVRGRSGARESSKAPAGRFWNVATGRPALGGAPARFLAQCTRNV
jgi:hypothetical protein